MNTPAVSAVGVEVEEKVEEEEEEEEWNEV